MGFGISIFAAAFDAAVAGSFFSTTSRSPSVSRTTWMVWEPSKCVISYSNVVVTLVALVTLLALAL